MEALDPESEARFDAFSNQVAEALRLSGWSGSQGALCGYCSGLLLPGERKSMEPIAARLDPGRPEACYASIQRLITDSEWDAQVVLDFSRAYALPFISSRGRIEAWIVDDTSFPRQGRHSVGVAHPNCGCRGNHQNCQVAKTFR
ncbi:transposase [Geothrix sp. 21YS21S-2]|uniref:transposase n=1 Tax=Geothrix sp. 21YS21S-2 TaxID=3068893 RepID=UPI0027B8A963|nr:transposase [Geothrix sp. 21YS21S-2]